MTTLEQVIETTRTLPLEDHQRLQLFLQEGLQQQDTTAPLPEAQPRQEREQERLNAIASAREAKLRQELDEYRRAKQWIAEHRAAYLGQWVALEGDRLISHGADALEVDAAAKAAGIDIPFVVRIVEERKFFYAGWSG